jgi:hypothetical protein
MRCEFRTTYAQQTFGPLKKKHVVAVEKELARLSGNQDM